MKFNIVLFCAFHCTFDDSVSNCHIHKFAKTRIILEKLSLKIKFKNCGENFF